MYKRGFMAVFNEIRTTLLDPNKQDRRQEIAQNAASIKAGSGLFMGGMGLLTIVSLAAMRSFPVLGGIFALIGAVGTVGAHEAMVVSGNTEEMTKGENPLGNVLNRASAAWSKSNFTQKVTKDTWVVGPLFGSMIEGGLKD